MTPFKTLARLAARQHHVVCTADLVGLGFSEEQIRWLVSSERIFRLYPGVFVIGRPDVASGGRWMAAVLACAAPAALSHLSASVFRKLLDHEGAEPEVIVPVSSSHKGPRGIRVHRSSDITEGGIEVVQAIRTTSVLRTLVDLSRSRLPTHSLNAAVRRAARLYDVDLQQLRGRRRLDAIVRLYDPLAGMTDSDFEVAFLAMCAAHGLPTPEPQRPFGPFRADFTWNHVRLVIECDSRWHDNHVSYLGDRRKERLIRDAGFDVLRFTWAEVIHEPERVVEEIKRAFNRRRRELRGSSAG